MDGLALGEKIWVRLACCELFTEPLKTTGGWRCGVVHTNFRRLTRHRHDQRLAKNCVRWLLERKRRLLTVSERLGDAQIVRVQDHVNRRGGRGRVMERILGIPFELMGVKVQGDYPMEVRERHFVQV